MSKLEEFMTKNGKPLKQKKRTERQQEIDLKGN